MNESSSNGPDGALSEPNGARQLRHAQITDLEIKDLVEGGKKLPPGTVNILCAKLQQEAEEDGNTAWCILSSWLGPLAAQKVDEGEMYGSIAQHALEAVVDGQKSSLIARTRWIVPLCSFTKPEHWILAWIDFSSSQIGFFNSIPELGSTSWAEPLFLKIIDLVFVELGKPLIQWGIEPWPRVLKQPKQLQRQFDDWSSGLFVLMAVAALSEGKDIEEAVGHDHISQMRSRAISLISDTPIVRESEFLEPGREVIGASEAAIVDASPCELPPGPVNLEQVVACHEDVATGSNSRMDVDIKETEPMVVVEGKDSGTGGDGELSSTSRKRPRASDFEQESDDHASAAPSASSKKKRSLPATKPVKRSKDAKEQMFIDDPWVKHYTVRLVTCKGCNRHIQLSNRPEKRPYEWKNWQDHRATCGQITGVRVVRVRKSQKVQPMPFKKSIARFFGGQESGDSRPPASSSAQSAHSEQQSESEIEAPTSKVKYTTRIVSTTPSLPLFLESHPRKEDGTFRPQTTLGLTKATIVQCKCLCGEEYNDYVELTNTRDYGGVSSSFVARVIRQIFPYKPFNQLKEGSKAPDIDFESLGIGEAGNRSAEIPLGGNDLVKRDDWTSAEHDQIERVVRSWARWIVDYHRKLVKATACEETTSNKNGICDECRKIAVDPSFKRVVRKKHHEASLPEEERRKMLDARQKYAGTDAMSDIGQRILRQKLSDKVLFNLHDSLKTGGPEDAFLKLFESAQKGYLEDHQRFLDVCVVLEDRIAREHSNNPNALYGIRYNENLLRLMIVLRGYGQNSNRQYEIISSIFGGPSARHLRTLVSRSGDSLKNPALIFENMVRVKRYVDSIKYVGPIVIGGDCTKVRKRLNYSTDFGAHILGTTLDLSDVEVGNAKDIDDIVKRASRENAFATQARAIIAKVLLPRSPPIVIALLPTNGTENADDLHLQHLALQKMAAQLKLPLVALAADGASTELSAQFQMDNTQSQLPPLIYDYPLYGIHLRAPVFRNTGPLISVSDPPHARKTARNQPQYGTHTASLGVGHLVNRSLVDLYEVEGRSKAGLVVRDVNNVDKQDDGAARRIFHFQALSACTLAQPGDDGAVSIRPGFEGTFVYLFILGSLFEAWMNPALPTTDRVLFALRARFWLHHWREHILLLCKKFPDLYSTAKSFISPPSFNIFNRLCDTLVLLALAYATHYPDQPFCIWLIATDFVEHFFGIARQLLPNFSYAEFIKMAQHIMVRQRILESGLIKFKRERNSAVGYIYNEDCDMKKAINDSDAAIPSPSTVTRADLDRLVPIAHDEALRICRDILHMVVSSPREQKPLCLARLGPAQSKRRPPRPIAEIDVDSDTDEDMDDDDNIAEDDDSGAPPSAFDPGSQEVDLNDATGAAAVDTARYSALCRDLEEAVREADLDNVDICLPMPVPGPLESTPNSLSNDPSSETVRTPGPPTQHFSLIDKATSKVSIRLMLEARRSAQSGTRVKSERTITVNKRYALGDVISGGGEKEIKFKADEAAHRLRLAQETNVELKKQELKKARELRWKSAATALHKENCFGSDGVPHLAERNVTSLTKLRLGSFVIMRSKQRFYIGEVLDIYKKGQNSRYGSIETSDSLTGVSRLALRVYLPLGVSEELNDNNSDASDSEADSVASDADDVADVPDFSCTPGAPKSRYHLHTLAGVSDVIYHLGKNTLQGPPNKKQLSTYAALRWKALTQPKVRLLLSKALQK